MDSSDDLAAAAASLARARRQYAATVLIGLAAAAAVAVGVSRPWLTAAASPLGLPRIQAVVTGGDLVPLIGALGLVLLASFGAVLATRGRLRRAVGALIVGCAAVVMWGALRPGDGGALLRAGLAAKGWADPTPYTVSTGLWRWLVLAGGAGCLAAGIGVVCRGAQWPTMGKRYDAPAAEPAPVSRGHDEPDEKLAGQALDEEALWRALDEGRDPTQHR